MKRATTPWATDKDDPYRQFACRLLHEQIVYAAVLHPGRPRGASSLSAAMVGGAAADWDNIVESERPSFDDWLDDANPDGATALMEMLGFGEREIAAYKAAVQRALESGGGRPLQTQRTSQYRGVHYCDKGGWAASIYVNGVCLRKRCRSEADAARQINRWIDEHGLKRPKLEVDA